MIKVSRILTSSEAKYGYHSTFLGRVDGIAELGLQPSGGSQFNGGYAGHSKGRIFLSSWDGVGFWLSKMEDIAHHNSDFDSEACFEWTPVVLRVDLDFFDQEQDEVGQRDSGAEAWHSSEVIDPDYIDIWDGMKWVELDSVDVDTMVERSKKASEFEAEDTEPQTEEEWEQNTDETKGWWNLDFDIFEPRMP